MQRLAGSLRRFSTTSKVWPRLKTAQVSRAGLNLVWSDGKNRTFNFDWLFRNRPENIIETGQNAMDPLENPPLNHESYHAAVTNDGASLKFKWGTEKESLFDSNWLVRFAQPDIAQNEIDGRVVPTPIRAQKGKQDIGRISWQEIQNDAGTLKWLEIINRDGLCIVTDVPTKPKMVHEVARRIGPVMNTIYGEVLVSG